jgi:hypothetical protein
MFSVIARWSTFRLTITKVQVQALMAVAVHNIKQMIRPRPAPGTEATPSERMYIPLATSYAVSC